MRDQQFEIFSFLLCLGLVCAFFYQGPVANQQQQPQKRDVDAEPVPDQPHDNDVAGGVSNAMTDDNPELQYV